MKSRPLFTDSWNSYWHFVFGIMASYFWLIHPLFIIYQLKDPTEVNLFVDLAEFFIGFVIMFGLIRWWQNPERGMRSGGIRSGSMQSGSQTGVVGGGTP